MMSTARTNLRGRLGVLIAGSLVFTALTAGAAAASVPTSMGGKDARLSRHGAGVSPTTSRMTGSSTRPRTPVPGFLLDRGRYTTFDAPKAGIETDANSINNHGQIVGAYIEDDADATYHGFLRDARGLFTTIDLPGARATVVSRINDRGQVVGYTLAPTEADPLAGARGFGLNDRGQIVGAYSDTAVVLEPPEVPKRGFLLESGRLTRLDPPGAVSSQALGLNDRGQVVGEYLDATGRYHGYVWERGRFTTIDVPGTAGTSALEVNNRGQVTGLTGDPTAPDGFLWDRGRVTTFDAPGATITFAAGLDDRGQVVGFSASDLTGTSFSGFLRDARGRFTAINRPGAAATLVFDINDRGQLVGVAGNPDPAPSPPPASTAAMGRMA